MSSKFIGRFDQSMLEEMIEFEKRYNKTWLWIKLPKKDWDLFTITAITSDGAILYNIELGEIFLTENTEAEIEVRWPENKFFNYENHVFWGFKIPDRQWKRAPCIKNYSFLRTPDILFPGKRQYLFNGNLLKAAFEETPKIPILETINNFKKSNLTTRALNNNFAISLPPIKKDFFVLWYQNRPIAEIHANEKKIITRYPYLKQEILDFNRDQENNTWNIQ